MRFKLERIDVEEAHELHELSFTDCKWPGDDHTYWVARTGAGDVAGFCSAAYWPDLKCAYLSRAAVTVAARGKGLQRRMIAARVKWVTEETDAKAVWTYTRVDNYPSIINLIRAGFKFIKPNPGDGPWHKFILPLAKRIPVKSISQAAEKKSKFR